MNPDLFRVNIFFDDAIGIKIGNTLYTGIVKGFELFNGGISVVLDDDSEFYYYPPHYKEVSSDE